MTGLSSRIPGFHKMTGEERFALLVERCALSEKEAQDFLSASQALGETAEHLCENAIGTFNLPLGIATNMIVDGQEVLVPMATEESSVVAAVCNGARQCRALGGVTTSADDPRMIAQIEVRGLCDPFAAKQALLDQQSEIARLCDEADPLLVKLGGGFRELEVRVLDCEPPLLVLHLIVDTRDAMGANAVNSMAELLAPKVEAWTGGKVGLRILSNLADRRLVRATARFTPEELAIPTARGEEVRDAVVAAGAFAVADPYRAATHNKGIMNGVSAVVLATGNDTRAIEAGAHAFASTSGRYTALSRWSKDQEGNLVGEIELPLAMGIVGGATRAHPTAQLALKIMGIEKAQRLAAITAGVGLIQNFSALKALATEGIQRGHMSLHAKNLAIAVGAKSEEIKKLAEALIGKGQIRQDVAEELLKEMRES